MVRAAWSQHRENHTGSPDQEPAAQVQEMGTHDREGGEHQKGY